MESVSLWTCDNGHSGEFRPGKGWYDEEGVQLKPQRRRVPDAVACCPVADCGGPLSWTVASRPSHDVLTPDWLLGWQQRLKMGPTDLATALGLPNPRTIHNWQSGRRDIPTLLQPALWAIEQGWRAPNAVVLDFAERVLDLAEHSNAIGIRRAIERELEHARTVWMGRFLQVQADRDTAQSEVLVLELLVNLSPLAHGGQALLQYGQGTTFNDIVQWVLPHIHAWTDAATQASPGSTWTKESADVPMVVIHHLFFIWGMAAIRFEAFDSFKTLMDVWLPMSIPERSAGPLWKNTRIFHPATLGRSATRTFDSALHFAQAQSYVKRLYRDSGVLDVTIPMDLLLVMYSVTRVQTEQGERPVYPNFRDSAIYGEHLEPFLTRLRDDERFCAKVAAILFDETASQFRQRYVTRADHINALATSHRGFRLDTGFLQPKRQIASS